MPRSLSTTSTARAAYGRGMGSGRGFRRYGQTKLANIVFTAELARRLQGSGVTAYSFHPGTVATNFNHNNGPLMSLAMAIIKPFSRSAAKGAETLVWLAEAPADRPGKRWLLLRQEEGPGAGRRRRGGRRGPPVGAERETGGGHAASAQLGQAVNGTDASWGRQGPIALEDSLVAIEAG